MFPKSCPLSRALIFQKICFVCFNESSLKLIKNSWKLFLFSRNLNFCLDFLVEWWKSRTPWSLGFENPPRLLQDPQDWPNTRNSLDPPEHTEYTGSPRPLPTSETLQDFQNHLVPLESTWDHCAMWCDAWKRISRE